MGDQGTNPDPLDAGGDQYPLSSVTTGAGTFMAKSEHMEQLTSGRITFATFPAEGTTSGIHLADGRTTDFNVSASGVQLCNELGILMSLTATVVAAADVTTGSAATDVSHGISDHWFISPTFLWVKLYEIFYGGSQLGTYYLAFNAYDVFRHLDMEEYCQYAEVLFLESSIRLHSSDSAVTGQQALPACAYNYSATDAVLDYSIFSDHHSTGQFATTGAQMPNVTFKGAGVPLSNTVGSIVGAGGNMSTVIPEEWLDYVAIRTWRQNAADGATQTNSGNQTRQAYFPMFNYVSQECLWLPGLNQRIRFRITWTNTMMNGLPINADKLTITNVKPRFGQLDATAGNHARRTYNGILPLDGTTPNLTGTEPTVGNVVRLRRIDQNTDMTTTIDGMWLKGYQYNADVAAAISNIHSSQTVVSRTTIPKYNESTVPYASWTAGSEINDTQQGLSGLMDQVIIYVNHRVNAYINTASAYGNCAQGLPINSISQFTLQDGSGVPYGVPNLPGILVQNFWQGCDLDRCLAPILFSAIGIIFTPELRAVLEDGSKHGSQYLNGLWRTKMTPKYTRATNAPGTIFGSGSASAIDMTYQTTAYCIGDNYATVAQTAVGSYQVNLM